MTIAASLLLLLTTIAASLLCSSAINRVGSVEEVMDGEDGDSTPVPFCSWLFRRDLCCCQRWRRRQHSLCLPPTERILRLVLPALMRCS